MKRYEVLEAFTLGELVMLVNEALAQGAKTAGGLVIEGEHPGAEYIRYYQAIVRRA